jgi:urease accessory protein
VTEERLVESILGNENDPPWTTRLETARVDCLMLDQWEAQKNRLRKRTAHGVDVAVSLGRGSRLRDGDILNWDEETEVAVVARIQLGDVMVIDLSGLEHGPSEVAIRTAVELGHAIGNQHWPAVVRGLRIYVPLTVDRKVMDAVMRTHEFDGVSHEFASGTDLIAYLTPHDARQIFGGANSTPHSHLPKSAA